MSTETPDWAGMWRDIVSKAADVAEYKLDKLIDKLDVNDLVDLCDKVYKHRFASYEEFCEHTDINLAEFMGLTRVLNASGSWSSPNKTAKTRILAKIRNFLKGIYVQHLYFIDLATVVDGVGVPDNADMVTLSTIVNLPVKLRNTHHFVLFGVNKLFNEMGFTINNSTPNRPPWTTYCADKCTDVVLAMQIGHYNALSSTIKYTIVGNYMAAAATARLFGIDCSVITHRSLLGLLKAD
jgi:hypothetical protein